MKMTTVCCQVDFISILDFFLPSNCENELRPAKAGKKRNGPINKGVGAITCRCFYDNKKVQREKCQIYAVTFSLFFGDIILAIR